MTRADLIPTTPAARHKARCRLSALLDDRARAADDTRRRAADLTRAGRPVTADRTATDRAVYDGGLALLLALDLADPS